MATQKWGQKKMGTKKNGDAKAGGAGSTPLAVTQEDCLVTYVTVRGTVSSSLLGSRVTYSRVPRAGLLAAVTNQF